MSRFIRLFVHLISDVHGQTPVAAISPSFMSQLLEYGPRLETQGLSSRSAQVVAEAVKTCKSKIVESTRFILLPVFNPGQQHFVLLVVSIENASVQLWDSFRHPSRGWMGFIDQVALSSFLNRVIGRDLEWSFSVADVPQQTGSNCGIFVIEFVRAFFEGYRTAASLHGIVSEDTMAQCRAHIEDECRSLKCKRRA